MSSDHQMLICSMSHCSVTNETSKLLTQIWILQAQGLNAKQNYRTGFKENGKRLAKNPFW